MWQGAKTLAQALTWFGPVCQDEHLSQADSPGPNKDGASIYSGPPLTAFGVSFCQTGPCGSCIWSRSGIHSLVCSAPLLHNACYGRWSCGRDQIIPEPITGHYVNFAPQSRISFPTHPLKRISRTHQYGTCALRFTFQPGTGFQLFRFRPIQNYSLPLPRKKIGVRLLNLFL